jgi:DNA primase
MGKISPVSTKYIVHASIKSTGVVEKPDVIGAIFGQTEGLLGTDLELRELQKSGRIGRIDVKLFNRKGKVEGEIIIPSSLNKSETAIIAASVETIQRIGPCDAEIDIDKIEDVRIAKRKYILERAKELLHKMVYDTLPDSREISEAVFKSVRAMEIKEYGHEKLPCGPGIEEEDELIVVEGRADVVNLLKHDFRNIVAMNGTSVPKAIIDLSKRKDITVFIDGDRGGELIVSSLKQVAEIDFVATAPVGREVEELTKKEIHKALRAKVPVEQAKFKNAEKQEPAKKDFKEVKEQKRTSKTPKEYGVFKNFAEETVGSKGAYILDDALQILGKVPILELKNSLKEIESAHAVVMDGEVDKALFEVAKSTGVKWIICNSSKVGSSRYLKVVTVAEL